MQHSSTLLMVVAVASATAGQDTSPDATFLDTIQVVEVDPAEGELTYRDAEGELHTLREGDAIDEVGGARVEEIGRTTLVLTRLVRGGDGQEGEALIVVRFESSGKTKVREYRTVPDVAPRPSSGPSDP